MARARNIKPGLFKNEVLGVADPLYTIAFEGLWVLSDREGRLEDRALRIKAEVFPYRDGIDMEKILNWLKANGFILRYKVSSLAIIQIVNFNKHQNPHKNETPSELPSSDEADTNTEEIGETSEEIGSTRADSLLLIPDSLSTAKTASPSLAGFEEFWSAYPKKKGKGDAEKAWKRNRINGSLSKVLAAIESQKQSKDWQKDDGQFIPFPATWLNRRQWEDECTFGGDWAQDLAAGGV